jgi:hypothetical protein
MSRPFVELFPLYTLLRDLPKVTRMSSEQGWSESQ